MGAIGGAINFCLQKSSMPIGRIGIFEIAFVMTGENKNKFYMEIHESVGYHEKGRLPYHQETFF